MMDSDSSWCAANTGGPSLSTNSSARRIGLGGAELAAGAAGGELLSGGAFFMIFVESYLMMTRFDEEILRSDY